MSSFEGTYLYFRFAILNSKRNYQYHYCYAFCLQKLAIANDLRFSASTFYAPVLFLVLCFIFDYLVRAKLNKHILWLGSKSLECFIGNGMVTAFVIESGIVQRQIYYLLANIVWIVIFVFINKYLPANK